MRQIRAIAVLPTLFTLGNLVCGFFAIVVASRIAKAGTVDIPPSPRLDTIREVFSSIDPTHNLLFCGGLIFAAMLFDTFDGQVARITRTTSDFGGQLDSLCDLVSFGVAPAILLVKMCPDFTSVHREAVWAIAALFACCVALRLARFNVENDEADDHTYFVGLPSPAGAAMIASWAMFSYTLRNEINIEYFSGYDWWLQRLLPLFAILTAVLMVSRIPYPHIVTQLVRGRRSFAHVVGLVFAIMLLLTVRFYLVPFVCCAYVATPVIRHLWILYRKRSLTHSTTS